MAKCLIVYHSYHHGNTEKVAQAMAEACGAELVKASEAPRDLSGYDLVGLGGGIAYGKHYKEVFDAAAGLSGKSVFVFSTSGMGGRSLNAPLIEALKKQGANVLGDFACKGYDTYGPFKLLGGIAKSHPDAADLEAAKRFASDTAAKV